MHVYGYARVSTAGQELDIQFAQLCAAGCTKIFCEKESAERDDRPVLKRLIRRLKVTTTIGRARFGKVSKVEGIELTREMRQRAADSDRRGSSAEERRATIIRTYRRG